MIFQILKNYKTLFELKNKKTMNNINNADNIFNVFLENKVIQNQTF